MACIGLKLRVTDHWSRWIPNRDRTRRNGLYDYGPGSDRAAFPNISHDDRTIANPTLATDCDLSMSGLRKITTFIAMVLVPATRNQHMGPDLCSGADRRTTYNAEAADSYMFLHN